MIRAILLLIVVAALASADTLAGDDKKAADKLAGTWIAVSWRRGDAEIGKDKVATELVLGTNTYEFPNGINRISKSGAFKLGDKGTIDFTPDDGPAKGKTLLGIYKVEADKLTLCFTSAGMDRPKEFKSGERSTVLAVYERKK